MGQRIRWKFPPQTKQEKEMEKKWYRRERPPYEARPRWRRRLERFIAIRFKRLQEEKPNHMDVLACRTRRADLGGRAWMVTLFVGFTTFEAACAGSVC